MWTEFVAANPILVWAFGLWLALCVGSFLNVVIYRLPIMMNRESRALAKEIAAEPEPEETPYTSDVESFNLMVPRSRCPNCGHGISALQNVPVISWLLMRGKCGGCKGRPAVGRVLGRMWRTERAGWPDTRECRSSG